MPVPLSLSLTHTCIDLSVKPQATGTALLKPLVSAGKNTLVYMNTLLAHCIAQSTSCQVSNLSENNVPIMGSKSMT